MICNSFVTLEGGGTSVEKHWWRWRNIAHGLLAAWTLSGSNCQQPVTLLLCSICTKPYHVYIKQNHTLYLWNTPLNQRPNHTSHPFSLPQNEPTAIQNTIQPYLHYPEHPNCFNTMSLPPHQTRPHHIVQNKISAHFDHLFTGIGSVIPPWINAEQ